MNALIHHCRRLAAALASLTAIALVLTPPGQAAIGTGVQAAPVVLGAPAQPGHRYQLPGLYVVNTGTQPSYYRVRVQRLARHGSIVPADWVAIGVNGFRLAPRQHAVVPLTLSVPPGASGGRYASDLVATTTSSARPGATALGAAAATELRFTIPAPGLPWKLIGLIALGLAGAMALVVGVKRSGLRLTLERGSAT